MSNSDETSYWQMYRMNCFEAIVPHLAEDFLEFAATYAEKLQHTALHKAIQTELENRKQPSNSDDQEEQQWSCVEEYQKHGEH